MSPWTKFEIQSQYCVRSGRSVPRLRFSASTAAWSANGPRIRRATFPGRTCEPKKTMTLRRKSVIVARPSRLRRKRAIARSYASGGRSPQAPAALLASVRR
jgi:hypothetical protein